VDLPGTALRASIFVGEDDTWEHAPLHHEIVKRARAAGLAGATVLRGCEGYGASSLIHTTRLLSLTEDLPIVVVIIDAEDRLRTFLSELDEIIGEGTVVLDTVEVLRYAGKQR
jgi:PII-like signaling protein